MALAQREARQRYLWTSSQQHPDAPALSRVLLFALDRLVAHDKTPLPTRARQRCCGACLLPLMPGVNCRVFESKHARRPATRRRSVRIRCDSCAHVTSFPIPAKPSSRSEGLPASSSVSAVPKTKQPKPSKGRRPEAPAAAVQRDAKRRRSQQQLAASAMPTEPPSTSSDTLFGFDFVPLT